MGFNNIYPKNDLIFKKIFGDPKNNRILISLLSSILDIPKEEYFKVEVIDPYFRIRRFNDKLGILDIKLKLKSGKMINIELQVSEVADMEQRVLFYASRMIDEQIGAGQNYSEIKKIVCIVICTDHNLIKDSGSAHNKYFLYDKKTNSMFTSLLEVNVIECLKFSENDESELATWMKFLNSNSEVDLDMIASKGEAFKEAVCTYKQLTSDEETRLQIQAQEDAIRDNKAVLKAAVVRAEQRGLERGIEQGIEEGIEKGIKKGIEKGENKRNIEIAKNLINMGLSDNQIVSATNLSLNELNKLRHIEKS